MVDVAINYGVTAQCGAPACTLAVASNEPLTGTADWTIIGPNLVQLRARRDGSGSGRVYTITAVCQDARGNISSISSKTTTVSVPHDQGKKN